MTDREVMKMALEALEFAASEIYNEHNDDVIADAIEALRQALAQPEQFQLVCKKCSADRTKDDCKGERIKCGIMGEAQSAQPDPVAWEKNYDIACSLLRQAHDILATTQYPIKRPRLS